MYAVGEYQQVEREAQTHYQAMEIKQIIDQHIEQGQFENVNNKMLKTMKMMITAQQVFPVIRVTEHWSKINCRRAQTAAIHKARCIQIGSIRYVFYNINID